MIFQVFVAILASVTIYHTKCLACYFNYESAKIFNIIVANIISSCETKLVF